MGLSQPQRPAPVRVPRAVGIDVVPESPVAPDPLLAHPPKHRNALVDIVMDPNLALLWMQPVQAAHVLRECSPPGERHRQKVSVEAGVVEPFADVPTGSDQDSFLRLQNLLELLGQRAALPGSHASAQNKHVAGKVGDPLGKIAGMHPALGEKDRRAPGLERRPDIVKISVLRASSAASAAYTCWMDGRSPSMPIGNWN